MASEACLIIYGSSVFLAGIKAQLACETKLELVTIEAGCPDLAEQIRARRPRAIIFDLVESQPGISITLLLEVPGLLLIGVDPSSDELLVMSGLRAQALNMADLLAVIHSTFTHKKNIYSKTLKGGIHETCHSTQEQL